MGNDKIQMVEPKKFQIRIGSCGTDTFAGSYKIWKDDNALRLLHLVATKVSEDFVGPDYAPTLRYHLACALLGSLNYPEEMLQADIKNFKEHLKDWKIIGREKNNGKKDQSAARKGAADNKEGASSKEQRAPEDKD